MCESHMKRAVDRRTFGNQNNRESIKTDLDKLKLAYNEQVIRDGCELFLQKWHPIEPEIADYIEEYGLSDTKTGIMARVFEHRPPTMRLKHLMVFSSNTIQSGKSEICQNSNIS